MTAQLSLALPHRPALGRSDFLVAPCGEMAVAWLDRWPDWPAPALTLYGPAGCGKTHMAQVWRARSGALALDPRALTTAGLATLPAAARAVVLDDAEEAAEEPLLHLYNVLAERGGHLLLVSRQPPARRRIALPDLRSRLVACPSVAVLPPDEALMGALLVKLFADRQLAVGEEVITYLLQRLERSFAAAQEAVAWLDEASLAEHRPITIWLARKLLERHSSIEPGP